MALRTPLPVQPNLYMTDTAGRPLDGGKVYFGESGKDPELYPISIFYDEALTIAAAQPVTTKNGFLSASGNIIGIYGTADSYSVKVLDANNVQVLYLPSMTNSDSFVSLLNAEIERSTQETQVIKQDLSAINNDLTQAKSELEIKDAELQEQINANGGGKFAYIEYADMVAAAALPAEDPDKLPANSSVDIINDTDGSKNGTYAYNGTTFTKSPYDPLALAKADATTKAEAAKTQAVAESKTYADQKKLNDFNGLLNAKKLLGSNFSPVANKATPINLLIISAFIGGFYTNESGASIANANTKTSEFIAVSLGDLVYIEKELTPKIVAFDSNFTVVPANTAFTVSDSGFRVVSVSVAYVKINLLLVNSGLATLSLASRELDWFQARPHNVVNAVDGILSEFDLIKPNLLVGVSTTVGSYLNDAGNPVDNQNFSYTDFVAVKPNTNYTISSGATFNGACYNANKEFIAAIATAGGGLVLDFSFTTPTNTAYVKVNLPLVVTINSIYPYLRESSDNVAMNIVSNWRDKTIAWYGTSIPAGFPYATNQNTYSHANLAVRDLGATIINKCVPNGGISGTTELSFVDVNDAINYQNSLLDIMGTAQNPDLVVFDYGVNDYAQYPVDINNYDPLDPLDSNNTGAKTKINTRDTSTFIGAYNFVIDAMLTKNPATKFCFITHFSDDNANPAFAKDMFYAKLNTVIEAIADYWNAPVLRLHKKTNYRHRYGFNSITPAMPDNIHPASGDGSSVQSLRAIMREFLISIG